MCLEAVAVMIRTSPRGAESGLVAETATGSATGTETGIEIARGTGIEGAVGVETGNVSPKEVQIEMLSWIGKRELGTRERRIRRARMRTSRTTPCWVRKRQMNYERSDQVLYSSMLTSWDITHDARMILPSHFQNASLT